MIFLTALLMTIIGISLLAFLYVSKKQKHHAGYLLHSADLRVLSQQIAKYVLLASKSKNEQTFKQLKNSRDEFEEIIRKLKKDNVQIKEVREILIKIDKKWVILSQYADNTLKSGSSIIDLVIYMSLINDLAPQVQEYLEDISQTLLVEQKATKKMVFLAVTQQILMQRIQYNAQLILDSKNKTSVIFGQFNKDAKHFGQVLEAMMKGNNKRGIVNPKMQKKLRNIAMLFGSLGDDQNELIIDTVPNVLSVLDSSIKVTKTADKISGLADNLGQTYKKNFGVLHVFGFPIGLPFIAIMGMFAFILMLFLTLILIKRAGENVG